VGLYGHDYAVSKYSPIYTHWSSRRRNGGGLSTGFVETMGESPTNCRLNLGGGQQAKRHRAVCNRGHNISPSVTRLRISERSFERPHLDYEYERRVGANATTTAQ
jgi:hypothetical protein